MLYSLLAAVLALSFLMPCMCFLSFKVGFKAAKAESAKELPKMFEFHAKKPKETEEQERLRDILANIDAFDGTSKGQKVI